MAVQALASIRELAVDWPYPVRSSLVGKMSWQSKGTPQGHVYPQEIAGRALFLGGRWALGGTLRFQ